jgi:hypothetical protein
MGMLYLTHISSVFVNGRPRRVIMEDMQKRIDRGDIKQERSDAIQVCSIRRPGLLTGID